MTTSASLPSGENGAGAVILWAGEETLQARMMRTLEDHLAKERRRDDKTPATWQGTA